MALYIAIDNPELSVNQCISRSKKIIKSVTKIKIMVIYKCKIYLKRSLDLIEKSRR